MKPDIISDELNTLRNVFVANGFDIRLVGGCVRDMLHGTEIKDIDLCTDANPEQQIALYKENNIKYIETGLQHGTISVVLDDVYEITSLRTETDHDGRHATVSYTREGDRCLNPNLLQKFIDMGYNLDQDYSIQELIEAFRHINR